MDVYFSIIVPVYNTSLYLRECLDSIRGQEFENFECLLIDDGSTDTSGLICDEYCVHDARFVCVHKEGGGISAARNIGIDKARGEYVLFVDSDDVLLKNALGIFYGNIERYGIPDVLCGNVEAFGDGNFKVPFTPDIMYVSGNAVIQRSYYDRMWYEMAWNKLVRRDFMLKNDLLFDESVKKHEDTLWSFKLQMCADNVLLLPCVTYLYRLHAKSLVHKMKIVDHGKSMGSVFNKMILYAKCHQNYNRDTASYLTDLILDFMLSWCRVRMNEREKHEIFEDARKELKQVDSVCFIKSKYSKGKKFLAFLSVFLSESVLYKLFCIVGNRRA